MLIRRAAAADALPVAREHVRSWQRGYHGLLPDAELRAMRPEDRAEHYTFDDDRGPHTWFAESSGRVTGFVTIGELDGHATVMALYVDPDHWRSGIGSALMDRAEAEIARQGYPVARLHVLKGNERAMDFYAERGWAPTGHVRSGEVWGVHVVEVEYERPC
ncbi:GNAT family N-acetyltransferase [Gordonia polyisoprenivorans]|uniref:GNAT family N-acetyltransferase n=1 Tax=Gordonia polyisoprenivorans TaxID=84595 RepID=UPI001B8B9FD8|nr:GNAT family N-acetyltransferase [Gordonia polyisoprenivorans]QUD83380.1 GNAT family N-acetyltransferase [Gordonia polyisoprenivorans]